jgi:lysophospholipase L1-like esterase
MAPKRARTSLLIGFITFLMTVVTAVTVPVSATATPVPDSMASLGDSITRGFNACGWYVDCVSRSWSTGGYGPVNSHYLRIVAANPSMSGNAHNDARSGAKVSDLNRQAQLAVSQNVEYVTILMGANDACTSSESTMTTVDAFESRFRTAMTTLDSGLPGARIFVASIPDIKRLWYVGKDSLAARTAWDLGNVCQSMLANPRSTASVDVARRDRVRQRVIDFNAVLADVCSEYAKCRFDGNAVFSYQFTLSLVSRWDYFHPNTAGQTVLADVTYRAGYGW